MSIDPCLPPETDLDRIDGLLADLGTIVRRAGSETLSEEDFRTLASRMRTRLKDLRESLTEEVEPIVLTDATEAIAAAGRLGRDPAVQSLLRRMPALMTARQLATRPPGTSARFYGPFAAIDGGRP